MKRDGDHQASDSQRNCSGNQHAPAAEQLAEQQSKCQSYDPDCDMGQDVPAQAAKPDIKQISRQRQAIQPPGAKLEHCDSQKQGIILALPKDQSQRHSSGNTREIRQQHKQQQIVGFAIDCSRLVRAHINAAGGDMRHYRHVGRDDYRTKLKHDPIGHIKIAGQREARISGQQDLDEWLEQQLRNP